MGCQTGERGDCQPLFDDSYDYYAKLAGLTRCDTIGASQGYLSLALTIGVTVPAAIGQCSWTRELGMEAAFSLCR